MIKGATGGNGVVEDIIVVIFFEAVKVDGGGTRALVGEDEVVGTSSVSVDGGYGVEISLSDVEASASSIVVVSRIGAVNLADADHGN